MDYTDYQHILFERRDHGILWLTLNRPEKRNALNLALVEALSAKLRALAADDTLRAVVLRGAGKAFLAGADIAELKERGALEALRGINATLFREVEELPVPVIAALHGWVLGGGMELAMACDVRVAAESARFGQPELTLGILPGAGGVHRLAEVAGLGNAKDLILTGRIIDAGEALRIGLVSRVVPDDDLQAEVMAAAEAAAGMAPLASRLAKRVMNALGRSRPDVSDTLESAAQAVLFESDEKHERMQAFLEKLASRKKS